MRAWKVVIVVLSLSLCSIAFGQKVGPPVLQSARTLPIPVDDVTLQRQFAALKSMPNAKVQYSKRGHAAYIVGDLGMVLTGTTKEEISQEVWEKFKDILLAAGGEALTVEVDGTDQLYRDVTLTEKIRGIPVVRGAVKLRIDPVSGRVLEFGAGFVPDRGIPKAPRLTAQQAADKLVDPREDAMVAKKGSVWIGETRELAYLAMHEDRPAQLVWEMRLSYLEEVGGAKVSEVVWVDSIDGSIAAREPADRHESVWIPSPGTASDRNAYPTGIVQLTDAQIAANSDAVKVKANFATIASKWNSFDAAYNGTGMRLVINYNMGSPNAAHTKVGGIDYPTFHKKTSLNWSMGDSLDTVAHEFAHAVAGSTGYFKPSGGMHHSAALDEGFADISAVAVDAAANGLTLATWRIGDGYRVTNATWALRSVSNPQDDYSTDTYMTQIDWYPNLIGGELNRIQHDIRTARSSHMPSI